jgi:GTPase SAR1 family protein
MAAAEVEATEVKIVLLGDSGVGKSSVAAQFVRGTYDNMQQPTIG